MGSNPVRVWKFFSGLISTTSSVVFITARIAYFRFFYRSAQIWSPYIYSHWTHSYFLSYKTMNGAFYRFPARDFSRVLPTSCICYYASRPIESVDYCKKLKLFTFYRAPDAKHFCHPAYWFTLIWSAVLRLTKCILTSFRFFNRTLSFFVSRCQQIKENLFTGKTP